MKSFIVKGKKPLCLWGSLPDEYYYEGIVPEGYKLAISPSKGYIILDVDVDVKKGKNGFIHIPDDILEELYLTLNYPTKRGGQHFWLKYTGDKVLPNKTSGLDIDLRTHKGYVVWYLPDDIRRYKHLIQETSEKLISYIEQLFYYKNGRNNKQPTQV